MTRSTWETLLGCGNAAEPPFHAAGSHRTVRRVEIRNNRAGEIDQVRIGRWRTVSASTCRRLAEVRELSCGRVALRIERLIDCSGAPSCEIWQLYDLDGRMEAALQSSLDGRFAIMTDYRVRQACRMTADERGELRPVETWRI